jgi:HAD superfamily hydrolase (TIGR01509 family)
MNDRIKAIVFDVGGVFRLSGGEGMNVLERIADMIGVPSDEFKKAYWKHNALSNVENMPWEDMIAKVVKVFNPTFEAEERVRKFVRDYEASRTTNKDLIDLFPKLHALGLKIGILSNATTQLRKWLEDEGIAPLADAIIISGEIGYQKPHKEAFDILFKRLALAPGEVVFVDDSAKSLEKADEIGYIPILFKNNKQLKDDLRKLDIPLPASANHLH